MFFLLYHIEIIFHHIQINASFAHVFLFFILLAFYAFFPIKSWRVSKLLLTLSELKQ